MNMRLDFEWHDAPGVADEVLKATWARLEIRVNDQVATEVVDDRSNSRRTGIYGSLFPLAEWVVEHWWNLLNEPAVVPAFVGGRDAAPWMLDWVQRHNLLAAREGGALPDLTMVRDGDEMVINWEPDPTCNQPCRVRFIGRGMQRLSLASFKDSLAVFVNAVVARLNDSRLRDVDTERLRESWAAIGQSEIDERPLCQSLATLGLDPYDPDESTESIIEAIERMDGIDSVLRDDLLQGTRVSELISDLDWIQESVERIASKGAVEMHAFGLPPDWKTTAHETGYRLARATRAKLLEDPGHGVIDNLKDLLVSSLGWTETVRISAPSATKTHLDALVGLSPDDGRPVVVLPSKKAEASERFRLARAAFFSVSGALFDGPRLVTGASTRYQRASRAFAAELLCPAKALSEEVFGSISCEQADVIAKRFKVSSLVVKHQMENHRLGLVEEP